MKITLYVLLFLLIMVCVNGFLFRKNRGRRGGLKIRRNSILGRLAIRRPKPRNSLQNIVKNAADKLKDLVKPRRKKSKNRKNKTRRGKSRRNQITDLGSSPVSPDDIRTVGDPRDVRDKNPADYSQTSTHTEPDYIKAPIVPEVRNADYSPGESISKNNGYSPDILAKPSVQNTDKRPRDYSQQPVVDPIVPETYVDSQTSPGGAGYDLPKVLNKRLRDYVQNKPVDPLTDAAGGYEEPPVTKNAYSPDLIANPPVQDTIKRPGNYDQQPAVNPIVPEEYVDPQTSAGGAGYDLPKVLNERPTGYGQNKPVDPLITDVGYEEPIAKQSVQDTIKRPGDYSQQPSVDPILPEAYVDPQKSPELRPGNYGQKPEISVAPTLTDTSGSSASNVASNTRDGYVEPPAPINDYASDTVPNVPDPDPGQGHTPDTTMQEGPEVLEVLKDPVFNGIDRQIFQQGGENHQGVACQIGGCRDGLHCVVVNTGNILDPCLHGSWDLCKCIKGCVVTKGILVEGRIRGRTCRRCNCSAGNITCRGGRKCSM